MLTSTKIPLASISKLRLAGPISNVAEIRLRSGRPAVCVEISGKMTECSEPFSAREISDVFAEICGYSVYSYENDIARGFVTISGGHRVGICGTCVYKNGKIETIRDISSLNIRIAHEVKGCANKLVRMIFSDKPRSLLLGGPVMSGKTTVLRDLARILSERFRVSVIDSRGEISAAVKGTPSFDVGLNTDVLCGCDKTDGILMALRTLSPEIIICDEIGDDERAIEQCAFCGAKIIASAHAGDFGELKSRPSTRAVLPYFDAAAIVKDRGVISEIHIMRE
ncbi:MAG: stage III sporulation protein AA [Oscillospiraceae bacterium]|nr:stage III sporulation protein AA [Oscillospiraceae bacterium]